MEAIDGICESKLTRYGELVLLGCNGSLPQGNRGRMLSKYVCYQRKEPNGVKKLNPDTLQSSGNTKDTPEERQPSISYTLSQSQSVIIQHKDDEEMDMFQIGRSSESSIDFVVLDKQSIRKKERKSISSGKKEVRKMHTSVSRFACRILVERNNPSKARIYAGAFDSNKNIHLGEKAKKWQENDEIDALTTNGVLIMHPKGQFSSGTAQCGVWRECSVGGNIFQLRGSRSKQEKTTQIQEETNILQDGTLINLCGVSLLWRTAEGLQSSPTKEDLYKLVNDLNCSQDYSWVRNALVIPVLVIPRDVTESEYNNQPLVYLKCGHVVQGSSNREQGQLRYHKKCGRCEKLGPLVPLWMGAETAFYVDSGPPEYAFNPCGHMTTEKTVKFWANVDIPHGTNGFQAECPFCATPILDSPGYIKLIF